MNYGKFFRLNQKTSKIEDGVAIYDYIDLPAYFEASESNKMSPKYPISVAITEDSVRFRVHYSAYKVDAERLGVHNYLYNVKNAYKDTFIKNSSLSNPICRYETEQDLKHMEEVILELPFTNDSTDKLRKTIKRSYISSYPLLLNGKTITFIHELIKKRYNCKNVSTSYTNELERKLYEKLHKNLDGDLSYSTLWLMDIRERGENKINLFKDDNNVVKFLRKLILDFMFDLKHSDVFQTSKYYQAMFSGLMSNFYFSALMHKCEYYFYREMITDIIENKRITDENDKIKEHIKGLYSKELIEAETFWVRDIINPLADYFFSHKLGSEKGFWNRIKDSFKELEFKSWDSWFASPEEEMRRVCFTTKEVSLQQNSLKEEQMENTPEENQAKENQTSDKYHICNAETIAMYLEDSDKNKLDAKLIYKKDNEKVAISQWFLRRFAFSDVLHLHLCRHAIIPTFTTLFLFLICLFIFPNFLDSSFWNVKSFWEGGFSLPIICSIAYCTLVIFLCIREYNKYKIFPRIYNNNNEESINPVLFDTKRKLVRKRVLAILLTSVSIPIAAITTFYIFNLIQTNLISTLGISLRLFLEIVQILIIIGCGYLCYKKIYPVHWLSNMHVFLPRLTASIAAAWLTLAIGNELFGAFFDSLVSWSTSILLTIIVFTFLMFEMNKMLPLEETILKVIRCLQVIAISYVISLITGLFIINFTGERFLERSGVLKDFYNDYVYNDNSKKVEYHEYYLNPNKKHLLKDSTDKEFLNELKNIHFTPNSTLKAEDTKHPITIVWDSGFFILRDFLIQFAFVAMFIGIFIQMLFEEKSITEI